MERQLSVSVPSTSRRSDGRAARIPLLTLSLASVLGAVPPALASNGVSVESVINYGGGGNDLYNANADADGFMNTITQDSFFSYVHRYSDLSVYDTDFCDSDYDGNCADLYNFDTNNSGSPIAISYFAGHGYCNAGSGTQSCSSNADCATPPSGRSDLRPNGLCVYTTSQTTGTCHYSAPRYLITHSANDRFGGFLNYNNFYGNYVAWGESPNAGSWRSAGTNGSTNLVVLGISCGAYVSSVLPDLGPAIAGTHLVATVMPTNGDTADVSDRGSTFANQMLINHNASVAAGWLNLVNNLPANDGCGCAAPGGGGGRGINGCGGYTVIAVGATSTETINHMGESWANIQDDTRDTQGISYWWSQQSYNYDTVLNPPLHSI